MLTKDDSRHWAPVPEVGIWLSQQIPEGARVLEVGPGHCPFPRADVYVDFVDVKGIRPDRLVKCDVANEPLPFPDKSFDFVICRHTLEDLHDPFLLCREMSRVAHYGYVETPSPTAELCRAVDGDGTEYRGYHHHRYVVWQFENELHFVAKYPIVELMKTTHDVMERLLRMGPVFWNTYYPWSGSITTVHHQCGKDFNFKPPRHYFDVLNEALGQSFEATKALL